MPVLRSVTFSSCAALAFVISASASPFPQLLPDAKNFELTVREDTGSALPLGSACGGEAAHTLACTAFIVTLKNVGTHTVHLSRITCKEPAVFFERKEPSSSSGWVPISHATNARCTPWGYVNLRLRPGQATAYRTRLVSQNRPADYPIPFDPGRYSIRADWALSGCTEEPEGTDCLAPLQKMLPDSPGMPIGRVEFQTPVEVVSKAIEVDIPALPSLGPLKIGFHVSIARGPNAAEVRGRLGNRCTTGADASMECIVFHFAIRNLGNHAIRNGRFSCSDFSIAPEYRTRDSAWKELQSQRFICTANFYFETPILPGKASEGDFTLRGLAPRFDTSPLYTAGRYKIRFRFNSNACFASPDGSFCIQMATEQVRTISNTLSINATSFHPSAASQ